MHNVEILRLEEVRGHIAQMQGTGGEKEDMPESRDPRAVDVVELRGRIARMDEASDRKAAGLSDGFLTRIRGLFTRKRS
jgi:hypothetical protein